MIIPPLQEQHTEVEKREIFRAPLPVAVDNRSISLEGTARTTRYRSLGTERKHATFTSSSVGTIDVERLYPTLLSLPMGWTKEALSWHANIQLHTKFGEVDNEMKAEMQICSYEEAEDETYDDG